MADTTADWQARKAAEERDLVPLSLATVYPQLLGVESPEQAELRKALLKEATRREVDRQAREKAGRDAPPRWDARGALHAWANWRLDGESIRSATADGGGGGSREVTQDERVRRRRLRHLVGVDVALQSVMREGYVVQDTPRIHLPQRECLVVLVERVVGRVLYEGKGPDRARAHNPGDTGKAWRHTSHPRFDRLEPVDVSARTSLRMGWPVEDVAHDTIDLLGRPIVQHTQRGVVFTVGHVGRVVKRSLYELTASLTDRGLMRRPEVVEPTKRGQAPRREGHDMSRPDLGWDVEGLKAIADVVAMSVSALREAMDDDDKAKRPPLMKYGERYVALRSELQAWARTRLRAVDNGGP